MIVNPLTKKAQEPDLCATITQSLNLHSFDQFDLSCLRKFCEEKDIPVATASCAGLTREHYLSALCKHMFNTALDSVYAPASDNDQHNDKTSDSSTEPDDDDDVQINEQQTRKTASHADNRKRVSREEEQNGPIAHKRRSPRLANKRKTIKNHVANLTRRRSLDIFNTTRRPPLTAYQRAVWVHIGDKEKCTLERLMAANWTWHYYMRKSNPKLALIQTKTVCLKSINSLIELIIICVGGKRNSKVYSRRLISPNGINYNSIRKASLVLAGQLPDSHCTSKKTLNKYHCL